MGILEALDRPIAFHRVLVTIGGSVTAALLLSQAIYWSKRTTLDDGWFYKVREEWEEETGLTRFEQETARKNLRLKGFLEEKLVGIPARLHYRVNREKVEAELAILHQQVGWIPANRLAGFPPTNTETTQRLRSALKKTSSSFRPKAKKPPSDGLGELEFPQTDDKAKPTKSQRKEDTAIVRRIFEYYLKATGRNGNLYTLTPKRMTAGCLRLKDCQKKCGGDIAKAEELMTVVIDAMVGSDFHMGKNDRNTPYTDWIDHLFKSTEKLEFWMARP